MNTPAIDYRQRIEDTFKLIEGGALLVLSMPQMTRNSDVGHSYRQHSFLHYLLGFEEPESALLLVAGKGQQPKAVAFVREKDALLELWEGARLGVHAAAKELPVDAAFAIDHLWEELPKLIKGVDRLYYELGLDEDADRAVTATLAREKRLRGRHSFNHRIPIYDAQIVANRLRSIKTEPELARMRQAAKITASAFERVYRELRPGMNERQIHGMLLGGFMEGGAEMEAYGSIVAGGANACCLHYHENNCDLKDGELILIDAGCQFQYYASDVTRTFPIGKTFTPEQKAIYEVVLATQLHGIDISRKGNTMMQIHEATCRKISEGLIEIGLLKGSVDEVLTQGTYKKYFPHGTGHWLGMDVHDVGDYVLESGEPVILMPGMVFTVEPGIYVDPNDETVSPAFRGIGVRIEDDVVITEGEPEVLTGSIAKEVRALENRY